MTGFAGRRVRPTELGLAKNRIAVLPDLCFLTNDIDKYITLNKFEGRINKKNADREWSGTTIYRPEMAVRYNVRMDDSLGRREVHWIEEHA
jgi:hypothetical protein